jgi:beta-N-acetylhexosaminidase
MPRRLHAASMSVAVLAVVCGACGSSSPPTAGPQTSAAQPSQAPADPQPTIRGKKRHHSITATAGIQSGLAASLGQQIISRVSGTAPGADLLSRIQKGQVGGVILFANNIQSVSQVRALVDRLQGAARAGRQPRLLIMTDQEGGQVKRLATAPPTLSPAEMGAQSDPSRVAASQGLATGLALTKAGINVDLAPVADVAHPGSFLGTRAFGQSPRLVAQAACAFAAGLLKGGVAPTLKHFPGLGAAPANTDIQSTTVNASLHALRLDLAAYRRCAIPRVLVMVSSAAYPAITGTTPAVLSPAIYGSELPRTGFQGVTISDDLEAPAITSQATPSLRAINAGLDLLLFGQNESTSATAYSKLLADLRSGRLTPTLVRDADARIQQLKSQLGRTG